MERPTPESKSTKAPMTDFKLRYEGSKLLLSFEMLEIEANPPLELIILIDNSRSMGKLFNRIKENLFFLLDSLLLSQDQVSIFCYGETTQKIIDFQRVFNDNKQKLKESIVNKIKAEEPDTLLHPALLEVSKCFKNSREDPTKKGRKENAVSSIFIFSDGKFSLDSKLLKFLTASYHENSFSIYTFQYEKYEGDSMFQVATLKDGIFYFIDTEKEGNICLASAISALRRVVAQDCSLEIECKSKVTLTPKESSTNWVKTAGLYATSVGQIQAQSRRNYIFELEIPENSQDLNLEATARLKIGQKTVNESKIDKVDSDHEIRVQNCRCLVVKSLVSVKKLAIEKNLKTALKFLDSTLGFLDGNFANSVDGLVTKLKDELSETRSDMDSKYFFEFLGFERLLHRISWLKYEKAHPLSKPSIELYCSDSEKMSLRKAELQNDHKWVPPHIPKEKVNELEVVSVDNVDDEEPPNLEDPNFEIKMMNKTLQKKEIKTKPKPLNDTKAKQLTDKRGKKMNLNSAARIVFAGDDDKETINMVDMPIEENRERIKDSRERIKDTVKWPYSAIGVVLSKFNGYYNLGSGVLIEKNLVLTCAHNLYCRADREECISVQFIPAMNGDYAPFGMFDVFKRYFPTEYTETPDKLVGEEDYALLVLKKPVGNILGHFALSAIQNEDQIKETEMCLYGYPSDKVEGKDKWFEQWGMKDKTSNVDENYIYYEKIMTHAGQSGSPLFYKDSQDDQEYYNCYTSGIHVLGTNKVRKATRITVKRMEKIGQWIRDANKEIANFAQPDIEPQHIAPIQPTASKNEKNDEEFDVVSSSSSEEDDFDYEPEKNVKKNDPLEEAKKDESVSTEITFNKTKLEETLKMNSSKKQDSKIGIKKTYFKDFLADEKIVMNEV